MVENPSAPADFGAPDGAPDASAVSGAPKAAITAAEAGGAPDAPDAPDAGTRTREETHAEADSGDATDTQAPGHWRLVAPEEVFSAGRHFRLNQTTGQSEVFEPDAVADEGGDAENGSPSPVGNPSGNGASPPLPAGEPTVPALGGETRPARRRSSIEELILTAAAEHPDWSAAKLGKTFRRAPSVVKRILVEADRRGEPAP